MMATRRRLSASKLIAWITLLGRTTNGFAMAPVSPGMSRYFILDVTISTMTASKHVHKSRGTYSDYNNSIL